MTRFIGWSLAAVLPLLMPPACQAKADETRWRAALAGLEKLADTTLKKTGIPGMAIAIVHNDRVVYLKGFGVREAGKDGAVDADTVFQLASVSKPITTTVLAALVGAKVIGWDDRVIDHYPEFRLADPWVTRRLTLRDLLCHRSGLPDHAGDLLEDLGYSRDEVLRRLRFLKPSDGFRSEYAYTNFGFTAAAVAAAKAAGRSWEDLSAEKLYRPLGMKSTSSRFRDYKAARNRAPLHVREGGKWVARFVRDPDAQSPAGGVSSTARDLTQWMRLQLGGGKIDGKQLIPTAALAETHRPQVISGFDAKAGRVALYGLGWNVGYDDRGKVRLSHSGGFSLGARTEVALVPAEGIGIAVLSNAAPSGLPEAMTRSFFDLLLHGKVQRDWVDLMNRVFDEEMKKSAVPLADYSRPPAKPSPALPPAAYIATYRNAYFGDLEIAEKGGGLILRLGPDRAAFALRHWDRDLFIYQPRGESATGPGGVSFRIGADGKASAVTVEYLNGNGLGTFARVPVRE